jgi:DNA modification methylase
MKHYYSEDGITIYHGDCREILPHISADVLVTDPPYGIDFRSGWTNATIANDTTTETRDAILAAWNDRPALVFGAAGEALISGAKLALVWHRPGSGMGDLSMPWKPDYELVHVFGVGFAHPHRGSSVLTFAWDTFRGDAGHPHRKPVGLMRHLIERCPPGVIVDTFTGSGSTLVAARDLGRRAIGIEIEERYCEIAAKRLSQRVLFGGAA